MHEGHDRANWVHTAALLACIVNMHKDPKKGRSVTPMDFDPYAKEDRRSNAIAVEDLSGLKAMFVGKGKAKLTPPPK